MSADESLGGSAGLSGDMRADVSGSTTAGMSTGARLRAPVSTVVNEGVGMSVA